jgi:hypothetical protein
MFLACVPADAHSEHPSHRKHHDLAQPSAYDLAATVFWDSKYVSEGRDNLEEGGLSSLALDWSQSLGQVGELALAGWYAEGTSTDYSELNLGVAYSWSLENIGISLGYTWLDFAEDDESDSELSMELGTTIHDEVDLGAVFTYSTEADGTFIELMVSTSIENEKLSWSPFLLLGINAGYVADEHDGLNNLQMGVEVSVPLSEKLELGGYLAYTIGLDEEAGESLDDIFWVGLSLGWSN